MSLPISMVFYSEGGVVVGAFAFVPAPALIVAPTLAPVSNRPIEPGQVSLCIITGGPKYLPPTFEDWGTPCWTYTGVQLPGDFDAVIRVKRDEKRIPPGRYRMHMGLFYERDRYVLDNGRYEVLAESNQPSKWRCSIYWYDICVWDKGETSRTTFRFTWDGASVRR